MAHQAVKKAKDGRGTVRVNQKAARMGDRRTRRVRSRGDARRRAIADQRRGG